MTDETTEDPDWEVARAIWAAGKVDIPARRDDKRIHLLSELKYAAGMFMEAKRVTVADQERKWSPDQVAQMSGFRSIASASPRRADLALKARFRRLLTQLGHSCSSKTHSRIGEIQGCNFPERAFV